MNGPLAVLPVVAQQTEIIEHLDRISSLLTILVIMAIVVGLLSAVALIVSLMTMRSASRLIKTMESQIDRLAPMTDPLIEKLTRLTDDVRGVTDGVRRRVNDLLDTVADVNDALRNAHRSADARVREFGAVLDVVQSEAEEVLLDGAATARGIHATAQALRSPSGPADGRGVARQAPDEAKSAPEVAAGDEAPPDEDAGIDDSTVVQVRVVKKPGTDSEPDSDDAAAPATAREPTDG